MAACTYDFDIPACSDNRLENFRAGVSNLIPKLLTFFSEIIYRVCCRFLSHNPLFEICSTVDILLTQKELQHRVTDF